VVAKALEPFIGTIVQRPSPNKGYGQDRPWWRAVTWHISEGDLESTLSWLTAPISEASAHFVIARDGTIYQLVPTDQAAWAQGGVCNPDLANPIVEQTVTSKVNPNLRSYSIECVGYSGHGLAGSLTQNQAASLQRVTALLCFKAGISADRTHILGHYQWDSCTRPNCPGFASVEWDNWIARVRNLCLLWRGW
jgi:N-acetyl-anhydromuramyl-L-alanine amidase AmpD